jgi:hypothetical protein
MKPCREFQKMVSERAFICPHCGAPSPVKGKWGGWGFEYKSEASLFGLPPLHISLKYRPNRMPVPAKGIIAIGQFGMGIINISRFGIGIISLGQFTASVFALAQFGIAYSLIAQFGLYIFGKIGQKFLSWQGCQVGQFLHISP